MVHVSELGATERVRHARDVVSLGQSVEVRVMGVDLEQHRISLSIQAAAVASAAREEKAEKADFERRNEASSGGFGSMADVFARALRKDDERS